MRTQVIPPPIRDLSTRAEELRSLLVRWCDQNSGSGHSAGLAAMLELLRPAFATLPGILDEIELAETSARALRVRVRPHAPLQLCFSGHYDTVYSADHSFQRCVHLDEETLCGPGVADMKGGLVVMLAALQAFEQTPGAGCLGYEIILGPDEETGSHGSAPLLAEAAGRHHFGLVFEPARNDGSLVRTRMGTGNFLVTCHGRTAHAAKAGEGRNAIVALAEFLVAAHQLPGEMPGILVNVGNIRGGGPETNVVPDFAEAMIDVRISQPGDDATLVARFEDLALATNSREGFHLEVKPNFNRPAKGTGPVEAAAIKALQTAGRDLGLPPITWVDTGGGSDGNLLYAAGLPNLDGLGPIGNHLHSDRECVNLPSVVSRAQLTALFLHRLATGEIVLPTCPSLQA